MTFFRPRSLAPLAILGVAALTAPAARAQYGFTKIADTTTASPAGGTFNFFDRYPAISGGNIAFYAEYSGGVGTNGIFANTVAGGALKTIVSDGAGSNAVPGGGTFNGLGRPNISGNNIAFFANYSGGTGTNGIFANTGPGGALKTIVSDGAESNAVPGGGTFNGFGNPILSGNNIAFSGLYTGGVGNQGVFANTGAGGALQAIATGGTGASAQVPGGGTFTHIFQDVTISGTSVAFVSDYSGGTGTQGIFANTGAGGALKSIATGGTGASAQVPGGGTFTTFGASILSGSNIAFFANYSGGTGTNGIFANTGPGGALKTIVSDGAGSNAVPGGGTFSNFGGISGSGSNIAFQGYYTGGGGSNGIFINSAGTTKKVVSTGDALFGSTISSLTFSYGNGLDGTDLTFWYQLANGNSGIAIATIVPEPGTLALLALGLPLLLVRRRRNQTPGGAEGLEIPR